MTDVKMPGVFRAATDRLAELRAMTREGTLKQRLAQLLSIGPRGVATHVARRAGLALRGGVSFRIAIVVLETPRPTPHAEAAAQTHTFRFATATELEAWQHEPGGVFKPWDVEALRDGCRCLLQHDGDELVGYTWASTAPLVELRWGLHFNVPDDMIYNYNAWTAPAHRGAAFQALRHKKLLELLAHEGRRRLLGYVDVLNYRSLHGVQKSGYRKVGELSGVRRGGATRLELEVEPGAWSEIVRMGPRQRQAAAASKMVQ